MDTQELYEVEISAKDFADVEQFEDDRRAAYDVQGVARTERLSALVEAAKLAGDLALYDVVLEKLTHDPSAAEQLDEAERRFEEVSDRVATTETHREHKSTTYRISISPDGSVQGVSRLDPIKEDKRATSRSKQISKNTGWGPKNNNSSFHGSVVDPSRRHI